MSKKSYSDRNLKFETLQLHRHHHMFSVTVIMHQQDLVLQMPVIFMVD